MVTVTGGIKVNWQHFSERAMSKLDRMFELSGILAKTNKVLIFMTFSIQYVYYLRVCCNFEIDHMSGTIWISPQKNRKNFLLNFYEIAGKIPSIVLCSAMGCDRKIPLIGCYLSWWVSMETVVSICGERVLSGWSIAGCFTCSASVRGLMTLDNSHFNNFPEYSSDKQWVLLARPAQFVEG